MAERILIGWREKVELPELDLFDIPAKIDTGARTSVLHCQYCKLVWVQNKRFVEFIPLDFKEGLDQKKYILPFHTEKTIRNSFGQEENRYVVKTKIRIGSQYIPIELSLRDRSEMEYPLLLGRSFLRTRFIIDVAKANIAPLNKWIR
jgi:hypothetical protein